MSKLIALLATFAFLLSSAAFAGVCDKDLMAHQARLAEKVAKLNELYPIPEYAEKTIAKYESVSARVSENRRMIWADILSESRVSEVVKELIASKASGVTRRGYAYSVNGETLSLTKDAASFSVTENSEFGPGFRVKNNKTGGDLQYESQSLMDRVRDPNPLPHDDLLAKLRRFGFSYFDVSEIEAALDLSLSAQSLDPKLPGVAFESVEDFSAALDLYSRAGFYAGLPLKKLPSKIARLEQKAAAKQIIIGDHDYIVKTVKAAQLAKVGETGEWISISDDDRVYWVKNPARGEDIRILSFKARGLKPLGSLVIKEGKVFTSPDWISENHNVVFALLLIFRDTGLE